MSQGGAKASKKEHEHHHHTPDAIAAGVAKDKKEKKHHHDKTKDDAKGSKKEKKHHHHHDKKAQDSSAVPVADAVTSPSIVITPSSPPVLSEALQARAEAATKELAENHDHLNPQHSATLDHMLANDPHADIAKGIFKRTTSGIKLEVLESQGKDARHLDGKLLPEHHGMVNDDVTETRRPRTTEEQMVFEAQELKKKEAGQVKVKPT